MSTTERRDNEFIAQLREMADVSFLRRAETIKIALRQWPNDVLWRQVQDDYNLVARERDLPEINP
jgi:hypothetical protein